MGTSRALLVIADIGGYTSFLRLHRLSAAHAHDATSRLLEAVIDAAPELELSAIEGDAAFLYAHEPTDEEVARSLASLASAMHRSFHLERSRIEARTLCPCDACAQVGRLTVKVVAHHGEVATQTVRGIATLAGVDVILVHRLLKNSVPISEYVLMTEPVLERCRAEIGERAIAIEEELEGLGRQRLFYVAIGTLAEPPAAAPSVGLATRARFTVGIATRALPYVVGLKRTPSELEPRA